AGSSAARNNMPPAYPEQEVRLDYPLLSSSSLKASISARTARSRSLIRQASRPSSTSFASNVGSDGTGAGAVTAESSRTRLAGSGCDTVILDGFRNSELAPRAVSLEYVLVGMPILLAE
ncbi:MAG: hypothetical protein ACRDQY_08275, partial [Pseudonocardiaceae bacterium]